VVELVTQDGAANGLQLARNLDHADRIFRLRPHHVDMRRDPPQLPDAEKRQYRAEQHQRAEAAIKPAADTEIEKRHRVHP